MIRLRTCCAVGGTLLLAVLCGPLFSPPVQAQEDARQATPPPGRALLFIFRSDREPKPARVLVTVNAQDVGELDNGSFLSVAVDPGKTFLRSGDRVLTMFNFVTAADQTYFVSLEAVHGLILVESKMRLVSEAEGRRSLEQSVYFSPAPLMQAAPPQELGPDSR
jgi:hypothetical protein